jgi:hypothetical protein
VAPKGAIVTAGGVFGGASIELLRDEASDEPSLCLWDGSKERIGALVEYGGRSYKPPSISPSLWRELALPTHHTFHRSTRDLLADIRKLIFEFVGLPERIASIVARFVLFTWVIEAVPVAPGLAVTGPDTHAGGQLVNLLHCLCRHSLRMGGVTPARLCSLPSAMGFTLQISQAKIGDKLQSLLNDASRRDQKIPHRGELLDLYGGQVLVSEDWRPSSRFLQIPILPGSRRLIELDLATQHQILAEFQPRLLGFRRLKLADAQKASYDASSLIFPLRELAQSLAAATPDDAVLRAEVVELLREEDTDIRSARWTDLGTIVVEALLVVCHEEKDFVYVGELAEIAQEIRMDRGEQGQVDSGTVGKRLKSLGFVTEPRDECGVRLRLGTDVCDRAHRLADVMGAPRQLNQSKGCKRGRSIS